MPHCPVIGVRLVQDGTGPLRVPRRVNRPAIAAAVFAELLADRDRETVATLLLATSHRPLGLHIVSVGALDAAPVHPREVFKAAVLANAASLIIAHNHPSGDLAPSRADHEMLRRLAGAGALLGIRVLDYIIVGTGGVYWSAQAGLHAKDVRVSIDADSRIARAIRYSFAIAEFAPGLV